MSRKKTNATPISTTTTTKRGPGRPKGSKNSFSVAKAKNKNLFLKTLAKNHGIIGPACKVAGICRQTYNNYYKNDPAFRLAVDEIREAAVDFVESSLYQQINSGNTTATIFYLKCKAKDRGYVEKTEIALDATSTIKIIYIVPETEDKQLPEYKVNVDQPITIKIDENK